MPLVVFISHQLINAVEVVVEDFDRVRPDLFDLQRRLGSLLGQIDVFSLAHY